MKISGKEIKKQGIEIIVFPRQDGDIVFKAKPVTNFEDFDKLCPRPLPPDLLKPGGIHVQDIEHPEYKKNLNVWAEKRSNWMLIQSLSATDNLTWDTINLSDSDTWKNFGKEIEDSGLSNLEMQKLFEIVIIACGLTQSKIEEATKRFLAGQAAQ
jgi:hypothetical protein